MSAGPDRPSADALPAERWTRAQTLFHTAVDLPTGERAEFVARAADGDQMLRAEVESLLAADAAAPPFLDTRPNGLPARLLALVASQPAAPRELRGGEQLGQYRVLREIARGGMGVVYLADDARGARQLALKVLDRRAAAPSVVERFRREVKVGTRLKHPNVLPVLDSGEHDDLHWFATPFIAGGSVRDRLRRGVALPVGDAVRIACEVARALQHAHECGIVHRDVKPENVLLTPSGGALLADFGISRRFGSASADADRLTMVGVRLGTPAYMSPEQACGDRVDQRSDVYSLACVLHEMLTGRPPFDGATLRAVFADRMLTPAPSARAARPEVPEAVDEAIRAALHRDPRDRVASAAEFASALGGAG